MGAPMTSPPATELWIGWARRHGGAGLRLWSLWRSQIEDTLVARVWRRLNALGFLERSLQFSAAFILFFIPFLLAVSAAIGRNLPKALASRSGFNPRATHDVTTLFAHGRTPVTLFTVVTAIVAIAGADSMAKTLQSWYESVFGRSAGRWSKRGHRALWLVGAAGYLALEFLIGRRLGPPGGAVAQFVLSVGFWWWSAHCLLGGQVPWRRLLGTGLSTAVCYVGVGLYVRLWAPWAIVQNQTSYGPIGAVMSVLAALVALGTAILAGAAVGAELNDRRGRIA